MFELGNSLREARARQGLGFPQVELATKIRAKYIRALEDEAFELLPSETYVKGFLRSYAEYLGLDGQVYVDEYNSRYGVYDDAPYRRPRVHQDRGLERKIVLAALAGIAALAGLVIVAWKFGGSNPSNGTPPGISTPVKTAATPTLGLQGIGRGTYVEVHRRSAGGPLLLGATVSRGKVYWVKGTRFWLLIRRPSGVLVTLSGRPVALPARQRLCVVVTPAATTRVGC